ncbi:MAG TPA: hypothetical protein VKW08_18345 [Xanthobacteraceae bacterium]|jgi:hypothetical protein|nr:hypothetical protein [Xanthobacteraceae bacterium]
MMGTDLLATARWLDLDEQRRSVLDRTFCAKRGVSRFCRQGILWASPISVAQATPQSPMASRNKQPSAQLLVQWTRSEGNEQNISSTGHRGVGLVAEFSYGSAA